MPQRNAQRAVGECIDAEMADMGLPAGIVVCLRGLHSGGTRYRENRIETPEPCPAQHDLCERFVLRVDGCVVRYSALS